MARTIDDAKALVKSWGERAGLDADGIGKLLANNEILEEARNQLTSHSEMASGIDRARNEAKAELEKYNKWYNEIAQPTVAEANKVRTAHQKYRETFGELDDAGGGAPAPKYASKDDLNNVGMSAVQVAKQIGFITSDYNSRYGAKFGFLTPGQLDEFEKYAVSRGISPLDAYKEWVAPKEQEIATAKAAADNDAWEAKLKAAREEGVREGQTRTQWAGESTRRNTDAFGRDPEVVKTTAGDHEAAEAAGQKAFLEEWAKFAQPEGAAR